MCCGLQRARSNDGKLLIGLREFEADPQKPELSASVHLQQRLSKLLHPLNYLLHIAGAEHRSAVGKVCERLAVDWDDG